MRRKCSLLPFVSLLAIFIAVPLASSFSGCGSDYCITEVEGRNGGSGTGNDYNMYFTLTEHPTGTGQTADYEVSLGWIYIAGDSPPLYSNVSRNNSIAGEQTAFLARWEDDLVLNGYIFSWNNSGEWVNESWIEMRGTYNWSNVTKTLSDTIGIDIGWRIYANDSSDNWNDTGIQVLTTTEGVPPDPITGLLAVDEGSGGKVILNWDVSQEADFDYYNVYVDTSNITDAAGMAPAANLSNQYISATVIGGLTDGIAYYFAVTAVDKNGNNGNENTAIISAASATPSKWTADDLGPNVVKGTVYMSDGTTPAFGATLINVTVTSGPNTRYAYITNIDAPPVPPFKMGNGHYDTGDRVGFSTGATFTVTATNGTHSGKNNGTFILGTLGGFSTDSMDVIMNTSVVTVNDTFLPTYSNLMPPNNSYTNDTGQDISIVISDEGSGLNENSLSMTVAGNYYETNSGKLDYDINSGLLTYYADNGEFNGGQVVYVVANAEDNEGNQMEAKWSFTIATTGSSIEYNISLIPGWNMISIPLEQDNWSIPSVLTSIEGNYTDIFAYVNGMWYWDTSLLPFFKLTDMAIENGYWINMSTAETLELNGTVPSSTTINVVPGWNLVGYPTFTTQNITTVLSPIGYTDVYTYKNGMWYWDTSLLPFFVLTEMTTGQGYWINATGSGSYEVGN